MSGIDPDRRTEPLGCLPPTWAPGRSSLAGRPVPDLGRHDRDQHRGDHEQHGPDKDRIGHATDERLLGTGHETCPGIAQARDEG